MPTPVRISDELYDEVVTYSKEQMRTISNTVDYLIKQGLNKQVTFQHTPSSGKPFIEDALATPVVTAQSLPSKNNFVPKAPDPNTGYPCCQNNNPCKHWTWDTVDTVWKNSLTGKIREV